MAGQSKVAIPQSATFKDVLFDLLVGSNRKKVLSATVLVIIAFLIYMKNKKSATENIKIKEEGSKKKVKYSLIDRKEEKEMLMPYFSKESKF